MLRPVYKVMGCRVAYSCKEPDCEGLSQVEDTRNKQVNTKFDRHIRWTEVHIFYIAKEYIIHTHDLNIEFKEI